MPLRLWLLGLRRPGTLVPLELLKYDRRRVQGEVVGRRWERGEALALCSSRSGCRACRVLWRGGRFASRGPSCRVTRSVGRAQGEQVEASHSPAGITHRSLVGRRSTRNDKRSWSVLFDWILNGPDRRRRELRTSSRSRRKEDGRTKAKMVTSARSANPRPGRSKIFGWYSPCQRPRVAARPQETTGEQRCRHRSGWQRPDPTP